MIPKEAPEPGAQFARFAEHYASRNADLGIGYRISEAALLQALYPHLVHLIQKEETPRVLEVGAGTGTSAFRMVRTLREWGVGDIEWVATEYNENMIVQGRGRDDAWSVSQADVQDLRRFPDASFHAVTSSQMLHWVPDMSLALREMHRVLCQGGVVIACSSGLLEGMGRLHFTEHPTYQRFLGYVEHYLTERGLWDRGVDGAFGPANPLVNSFFHRFTVVEVLKMVEEVGFVNAALSYHRVPVNRREMVDIRMQKGSTFMFLWNGEKTKQIPRAIADAAVDYAREEVVRHHDDELEKLNAEPTDDATLRFVARKQAEQ